MGTPAVCQALPGGSSFLQPAAASCRPAKGRRAPGTVPAELPDLCPRPANPPGHTQLCQQSFPSESSSSGKVPFIFQWKSTLFYQLSRFFVGQSEMPSVWHLHLCLQEESPADKSLSEENQEALSTSATQVPLRNTHGRTSKELKS